MKWFWGNQGQARLSHQQTWLGAELPLWTTTFDFAFGNRAGSLPCWLEGTPMLEYMLKVPVHA